MLQTYIDTKEELRWDREHVGLEYAEAQVSQDQREIGSGRVRGNVRDKSDQIKRPKVVILEALPQPWKVDSLAVVHIALGWVVSKQTIYQNLLFALSEPAVLAS